MPRNTEQHEITKHGRKVHLDCVHTSSLCTAPLTVLDNISLNCCGVHEDCNNMPHMQYTQAWQEKLCRPEHQQAMHAHCRLTAHNIHSQNVRTTLLHNAGAQRRHQMQPNSLCSAAGRALHTSH